MYSCMFCVPIWEVMKRLNLFLSFFLLFVLVLFGSLGCLPAPFTNLSMHGQIGAWMGAVPLTSGWTEWDRDRSKASVPGPSSAGYI